MILPSKIDLVIADFIKRFLRAFIYLDTYRLYFVFGGNMGERKKSEYRFAPIFYNSNLHYDMLKLQSTFNLNVHI